MKKIFSVLACPACGQALAQVQVTTDFSKWVEYPLMKKGFMRNGWKIKLGRVIAKKKDDWWKTE